jgi:hypothetical protein
VSTENLFRAGDGTWCFLALPGEEEARQVALKLNNGGYPYAREPRDASMWREERAKEEGSGRGRGRGNAEGGREGREKENRGILNRTKKRRKRNKERKEGWREGGKGKRKRRMKNSKFQIL